MVTLQALPARQLGKLRDWLEIVAALRRVRLPMETAEDLREALSLVALLGRTLGVDEEWISRVSGILDNPAAFEVVLAISRWVTASLFDVSDRPTKFESQAIVEVAPQALADWLPIVLQIVELLRRLRH